MNNLKQSIDKPKPKKSVSNYQATLRENKPLSRSALPAYEKDKCIFCQLDKPAPAADKRWKKQETVS